MRRVAMHVTICRRFRHADADDAALLDKYALRRVSRALLAATRVFAHDAALLRMLTRHILLLRYAAVYATPCRFSCHA